jgi:hypothetical protein
LGKIPSPQHWRFAIPAAAQHSTVIKFVRFGTQRQSLGRAFAQFGWEKAGSQ